MERCQAFILNSDVAYWPEADVHEPTINVC
jgi:hypothetical protein